MSRKNKEHIMNRKNKEHIMNRKLKELPLLSATLFFVSVIAVGAFAIGCGAPDSEEPGDGSGTVETSDPGTSDSTAADTHDDDDDDGDDHEEGESNVSAESFDDVAAVWEEVMALKAELDGLISSRKLVDVHKAAFAVRDHVNMLPDKSHDLSDDARADLDRGVRRVASLAAELDEAGDNGRQEEAEELSKTLQTVLDAIEAIYPSGVLK